MSWKRFLERFSIAFRLGAQASCLPASRRRTHAGETPALPGYTRLITAPGFQLCGRLVRGNSPRSRERFGAGRRPNFSMACFWMCAIASSIESVTLTRRSEEHTSELQSLRHLVCRLLLEK